jgi:hypothetical protein
VLRSGAPAVPPSAPSIDDLLADPAPPRGAGRPLRAPDAAPRRDLAAPDDPWAEQTPPAPPPEAARRRTSGTPGWAGLVDLDDAHAHEGPAAIAPIPPLAPVRAAAVASPRGPAEPRARGLELPMPAGATPAPSRAALVDGLTLEDPAAPHPLDELVAPSASGPKPPATPRRPALREYREVIGIVLATVVAAGAAMVYLRSPEPATDKPTAPNGAPTAAPTQLAPTSTPTSAATAGAPSVPPQVPAQVAEAQPDVTPGPARRAAVPLLSVLSDPPGAEVVVDGEVLGKTPLILPAPNVPSLVLTLRLDGYVDWVGQVKPSAAGHMSLSPALRKR